MMGGGDLVDQAREDAEADRMCSFQISIDFDGFLSISQDAY